MASSFGISRRPPAVLPRWRPPRLGSLESDDDVDWTLSTGDDNEWAAKSAWSDIDASDAWDLYKDDDDDDNDDDDDDDDDDENAALLSMLWSDDPELEYLNEQDLGVVAAAADEEADEASDEDDDNEEEDEEEAAAAAAEEEEEEEADLVEDFVAAAESGESRVLDTDDRLGVADSHEMVEVDAQGEPYYEKFVYVDEHACIGCTNCAGVAPSTFFMEGAHGRARVFQQQGDADDVVEEAILTCPVDCIHYVPWEELVSLEGQRRGQVINNAARLVNQQEGRGGSVSSLVGGAYRSAAPLEISGNQGLRCGNCPSNGCKNCPMYSVGANPEYVKKRNQMRRKRKERALAADDDGAVQTTADL